MTIALGADHAGFELKQYIKEKLEEKNYTVQDYGTNSAESVDYPDFAVATARAVAEGKAERGILICGSGIGVNITANKVEGIRAANCLTTEMAALSRQHNNANVLTLGSRLVDEKTAEDIALTFLATEFEGGRHERRVEKIHSLTGC
jgi:ribose 5-phosphate isomerase B